RLSPLQASAVVNWLQHFGSDSADSIWAERAARVGSLKKSKRALIRLREYDAFGNTRRGPQQGVKPDLQRLHHLGSIGREKTCRNLLRAEPDGAGLVFSVYGETWVQGLPPRLQMPSRTWPTVTENLPTSRDGSPRFSGGLHVPDFSSARLIPATSCKDWACQPILFWSFTAAPGPFPTTWSRRTSTVCAMPPLRDGACLSAAAPLSTQSKRPSS